MLLFVVADADVDAAAGKLDAQLIDWCLGVVIGEEHLRLDGVSSFHQLSEYL